MQKLGAEAIKPK